MSSCVFCNRIANEDYVDCGRGVVMFEPLNPVTPGHMLFIPLVHSSDAAEQPWVTGAVFEAASAYGEMVAKDFNLITSKGASATQSIRHLHVHYVPRRERDGLSLPWTNQLPVTQPANDIADYGPLADHGIDEMESICRRCGRPAIEHAAGKFSIYGTCPSVQAVDGPAPW